MSSVVSVRCTTRISRKPNVGYINLRLNKNDFSPRLNKVKEHDAIVGEKGVLFGQLMKRNDELSLLYDKIRIQTSSLHQGEVSLSPTRPTCALASKIHVSCSRIPQDKKQEEWYRGLGGLASPALRMRARTSFSFLWGITTGSASLMHVLRPRRRRIVPAVTGTISAAP